jgi:tagatose-1,6-bisphosphate aldolase
MENSFEDLTREQRIIMLVLIENGGSMTMPAIIARAADLEQLSDEELEEFQRRVAASLAKTRSAD